ncbi:MAG: MBL fold metallo-hydrolase [Planctomycetota bacterium]|nr:MBL fold metallo-hydrolase [Planctomycetota bacterium]
MTQHILALSMLALSGLLLAGRLEAAGPLDGVERFQVGDAAVWAIADSLGDRDMNVFPQADPEAVRRYVPSGKAPSAIMVYAVQAGGETILIDTGLGGGRTTRLMLGLAQAGINPEKVGLILITHMHGDHIGGLLVEGKKAFPNAKVKIGRRESAFWLSDQARRENPSRQGNFDLAKQVADAYAGAMEFFDFEDLVAPGFQAMEAVGHTPGHTAFLFESRGERLLFIGDLLHAAALQFPRPDINASYDMNPEQAAATRRRLLELAAREKLPVAGIHLPFAGVGRVEKSGEGFSYRPGKD